MASSARMRAVPEPPDPGSTREDVVLDAALKIEEMPAAEEEVTEGEVFEEPAPPADDTADQLLRSIYSAAHNAQTYAAETRADVATIRKTVAGGVLVLLCILLLASMGRKGAPTT